MHVKRVIKFEASVRHMEDSLNLRDQT